MLFKRYKEILLERSIRKSVDPAFFDIQTHMTREELMILYDVARSCPPNSRLVEVGSYLGASTSFLACGARIKNSMVYAVDTWQNMAMSEGPRDTFAEFEKNTENLKEFIVPMQGISEEVACKFDKKIDLLFIDGDHSYEGCMKDWMSWSPRLKPCAVVVFHDSGWAEGVKRVIDEQVATLVKKEKRLSNLYLAWLK